MRDDDLLKQDFHIHTNYVDGESKVFDIAEYVKMKELRFAVIAEHVRRELTYDYEALRKEVDDANDFHGTKILLGAEAKILNKRGDLDIPWAIKNECPVLIGAVHDRGGMSWREAYEGLINSDCHIIAHPTGMPIDLINEAKIAGKFIELNESYPVPDDFIKALERSRIKCVVSSDAHRLVDIGNYAWVRCMMDMFRLNIICGWQQRW